MLAIVVLAVVATLQVECAPNQLWPAHPKPSLAPAKKPVFGLKEEPTKVDNTLAMQQAYEQFINTWLQQASLTLNRPDLLRFLQPAATPAPATPAPVIAIGKSVVQPVVEPVAQEVVVPVSEVPVAEPFAEVTTPLPVEPVAADFVDAAPVEELPFFQDAEPEVLIPEVVEPEVLIPEVVAPEVLIPETVEPEVQIPEVVEPEVLIPEVVEPELLIPEAVEPEVPAEPLAPVELKPVPVVPEILPTAVEPEMVEPVAVEPEVFLPFPAEAEVPAEPIPSLVELDTAPVLLATEAPTPLFPLASEPVIEEVAPSAKSFTSVNRVLEVAPIVEEVVPMAQDDAPVVPETLPVESPIVAEPVPAVEPVPVVQHASPVTHSAFPGAIFFPSIIRPARPGTLPASNVPGAVTTEGLAYTLQYFPTRDRSHFFVSTNLGG